MGFVKPKSLAVLFLMALLFGAINLSAQETTSISGTITAAYTYEDSLVVGDGYIMTLGKSEGVNANTGEQAFMDGAKTVIMSFSDLASGTGPHQGHTTFISGGDTVYAQWKGEVTTVMDAEGAPSTTFKGTLSYTMGTGQFVNIQGDGTFWGEFTSEKAFTAHWKSEYVIAE